MATFFSKTVIISCRQLLLKPYLRASLPNVVCTASMTSKEFRDPNVKKPAPFPYETKNYNIFHWFFDSTLKRFDENTKLLVVEGNIGAGKSSFAKHIAETFEMKYVPEPDLAKLYFTPYGYDLRQLDHIMPPSYKSCTIETFYKNPFNRNVALMQYKMLMERYSDYLDAVTHILNTGQGVVLDRSVYSDIAFMEAMFQAGYFRKEVRDMYLDIYKSVTEDLLPPHLIIYLDIPVNTALERIKKRNIEYEINSQVLTPEYLGTIETIYKDHFLKEMETYSEVMVYDWSNYGDLDVVVEDIEKMDFDKYGTYDKKLRHWRYPDDWEWSVIRKLYTNHKNYLYSFANKGNPHVHEVYHQGDEVVEYKEILKKIPGMKYREGFNKDQGDTNINFKSHNSGKKDKESQFDF